MSELLPAGRNGVVHGRGSIIPLSPVPAEEVDSGAPRQGTLELGGIGGCATGIWELRNGAVHDTEIDEIFVVISGGAQVKLIDEGRTVDLTPGDVMRLTAGTRTQWVVKDHIRKVFLSAR